jgi:hypothetical protein
MALEKARDEAVARAAKAEASYNKETVDRLRAEQKALAVSAPAFN